MTCTSILDWRAGRSSPSVSPEMGAGQTTCARQYPTNSLTPLRNPNPRRLFVQPRFPPLWPRGMAQFRDKDRAALHCNAALRARTDALHTTPIKQANPIDQQQPMISKLESGSRTWMRRGLAETPHTPVAVAFRHRIYLGRMIGHAQKPRYVVIVLPFFLHNSHCLGLRATLFRARPSPSP